jgi:predicted DNA-binding transcriptional regulator AlpA
VTALHLRLVDPAEPSAVAVALADLEHALDAAPVESIPEAIGALARLDAMTRLRLVRLAQLAPVQAEERLLNVEQAAARLGMTASALYHRAQDFPFTVRQGRRLRFSSGGIDTWIRRRAR